MTGFIPVPPEPWVPTATDSETKLFPDATMDALDEHNDGRYATTEQGEKADSAYQLPEAGVPATDLEESVQTSLGKADAAVPNTVEGRTALAASPELGAAYAGKGKGGVESLGQKKAKSLVTWFSVLANRDFGLAKILVLSDSNGEGAGASGVIENRWIGKLRTLLAARMPTAGLSSGGQYLPAAWAGGLTIPDPATISGGPATGDVYGLGFRTVRLWDSDDQVTWLISGTSFKIAYVQAPSAATFQVRIDGGSWTSVTRSQGAILASRFWTSPTLTDGAHTIDVKWESGDATLVEGIWIFKNDESKGIQVLDGSHGGYGVGEFVGSTRWAYLQQSIAAYSPRLIIIGLGLNNWAWGNMTPAVFKTRLQTLVTGSRAAATRASVVILIPHKSTPGAPIADWSEYVTAAEEVAEMYDDTISINLTERLPDLVGDALGLYADTAHYSNRGHQLVADIVATAITP